MMLRLRFRISFPEGVASRATLAIALLPAVLLGMLTVSSVRATAPASLSAPSATFGVRQFYLSRSYVQADEAPSACAEGYHFASIWEIADPSGLRYNTDLGLPSPDSGEGPPTAISLFGSPFPVHGWVRTGYDTWLTAIVGQANCNAWDTNSGTYYGTVANLPSNWTGGSQDVGVWNTEVRTCDSYNWVWCVQDDSVLRVFLPLVLRND